MARGRTAGLTTRQVRRLVARLREPDRRDSCRVERDARATPMRAATAERALAIIRDRYVDFGPTLACEKLHECHGIRLAKETVRR